MSELSAGTLDGFRVDSRGRIRDNYSGDASEIAELLGGEVTPDGHVAAPSPGQPADDRSLIVRVNPSGFFVYTCDCPEGQAWAHVRERLKLVPDQRPKLSLDEILKPWTEAGPAAGTMIELYLRSRGLALPPSPVLRFHGSLWHAETKARWPAMVALITDREDNPIGVHRTYLAPVEPRRKTLGRLTGGAVRLFPVAAELAVGEGIETSLSGAEIIERPGWAALSTHGIKTIALPNTVRSVALLVDDDGGIGERACAEATTRLRAEGREVLWARPKAGFKDFNDELRGAR